MPKNIYMIGRFLTAFALLLALAGCKGGSNSSTTSSVVNTGTTSRNSGYDYIPKGSDLTDAMAVKFLNMATFGATPKLVKELRSKGVVGWIDEQLNKEYDPQSESILRKTLSYDIATYPQSYSYTTNQHPNGIKLGLKDIDTILADNDTNINTKQGGGGVNERFRKEVMDTLLGEMISDEQQLRQRVAYALSQITIASQSFDRFFGRRFEALAYYYDILLKNSYANYGDFLYELSLSPAMGTYLTYSGNRAAYTDANGNLVTPDENYGREIMQLFTLSLYQMNMNGTLKESDGRPILNYTQEDVVNMSRIFTGLDFEDNRFGRSLFWSKHSHHPMVCYEQYHDSDSKEIIGHTIERGGSCYKDIKAAIDILLHHPSHAPFLAKKLIMRLTKSNPKPTYIKNVAMAYVNSGMSLKAAVKAVYLDRELWEDIVSLKGCKIKEPWIAYTGILRSFGARAPKEWNRDTNLTKVRDRFHFAEPFYDLLAQVPLFSPTVFNFYSDDYAPKDYEFRQFGFVAPEMQIITTGKMTNYSNLIYTALTGRKDYSGVDAKYGREANIIKSYSLDPDTIMADSWKKSNYILDASFVIDAAKEAAGGTLESIPRYDAKNALPIYKKVVKAIVERLDSAILGGRLSERMKDIIVENYSDPDNIEFASSKNANRLREVYEKWIVPISRLIFDSELYRVQ